MAVTECLFVAYFAIGLDIHATLASAALNATMDALGNLPLLLAAFYAAPRQHCVRMESATI